jgi:hypothetical protein
MGFIAISTTPQTNKLLSQLSVGFPNYGFVADKLCPIVDVGADAEQGVYFSWDKYYLNGTVEDVRAVRGHSNEPDDPTVTENTYNALAHSLAKPIDPREFKQHKNKELKLAESIQEGLLSLLLIKKEKRVADLFTTAGNYASDHKQTNDNTSGKEQWSDFINSDPEAQIEVARDVVSLSGFEPNTIMIPITTWRKVRQHPQIRALIKSLDSKLLTDDMIVPSLFGLELVVPGSRNVTSLPGATEAIARIWGDFVWLGYVNKKANPVKMDPTFAYTFQAEGRKTETFKDRKNEIIDVQYDIAVEKITAAVSGYLFTDVIA